MPNLAYTGENFTLTVTPEGGGAVVLSDYARNIVIEEDGAEYDVTTYAEAQTGDQAFVPGLVSRKLTCEVMAQAGDTAIKNATAPRTKYTSVVLNDPDGGYTETYSSAHIVKRSRPAPYNDAVVYTIEMRLNGAAT